MSQIDILPADRFGYGFVDSRYLGPGADEYYLRNEQTKANGRTWRNLTDAEIAALEKNDNVCKKWSDVLVEDPFDPSCVKNSLFAGLVRIASLKSEYLRYHDFIVPAGISNSRIISCDIGTDCAIHDCAYLSHYIIGDGVIMSRIDEMSSTDHAKFGQGVVMDGEDEDVRIWIDPMNEAGGRSVLPFAGMTCADAWLWATYRDDSALLERLKDITQKGVDTRRGRYGTVGDGSVIKSCQVIKDVMFGPSSYVKGANKLKNLTIHSAKDEPTQIGEGVELVNGIIGYGCHIFYGVKAVRFVLGNNSNLKYGARLIHSILGDNSTISCCEVLNNLVFPGHEQHHNNSFLIATLIMGQSNMAAGATVGSNHNSRGNDGEIVAGRGFWPGLSSTLKHNCRFASYILLTKGSYPAELNIMFPFAMVYEDRKNDILCVMPAYYWLYNMYALERNSWKYRTRDRRKRVSQRIETNHLAPDTAFEMVYALRLLERWTGKAWYVQQVGVGAFPEGTGVPLDNAVLEAKGRELIENSPEVVNALVVRGEMMERFTREVRIIKVVKAWKAYRQMLLYYGVSTVAEYLATYGIHYGYFAAQNASRASLAWVNMGGQLVPESRVDGLRAGIRSSLFNSWDDIHAQYEQWWAAYPKDKAENAYECLKIVTGSREISTERWNSLIEEAKAIRDYIEEQVYVTKKKDYTNAYRGITYRNEAERDAVLGTVEDNSFIKTAKKDSEAVKAIFDKVRA
jgi:carbonic anhydrase/acetyltransferase-like protein (isoleucine patch superfamily)